MNEEIESILNRYAVQQTTTDEEKKLLLAAAADQSVFDALVDEDSLRALLDDDGCRQILLAAVRPPNFWERMWAVLANRRVLVPAFAAGLMVVAVLTVWVWKRAQYPSNEAISSGIGTRNKSSTVLTDDQRKVFQRLAGVSRANDQSLGLKLEGDRHEPGAAIPVHIFTKMDAKLVLVEDVRGGQATILFPDPPNSDGQVKGGQELNATFRPQGAISINGSQSQIELILVAFPLTSDPMHAISSQRTLPEPLATAVKNIQVAEK